MHLLSAHGLCLQSFAYITGTQLGSLAGYSVTASDGTLVLEMLTSKGQALAFRCSLSQLPLQATWASRRARCRPRSSRAMATYCRARMAYRVSAQAASTCNCGDLTQFLNRALRFQVHGSACAGFSVRLAERHQAARRRNEYAHSLRLTG